MTGRNYTVGRNEKSKKRPEPYITIDTKEDPSISRIHATVVVDKWTTDDLKDLSRKPSLYVHDGDAKTSGSKHGTKLNNKSIDLSGHEVKSGDLIKFGRTSFIASYQTLVVCLSQLKKDEKRRMLENLSKIGAHLVDEVIEECTVLAMTEICATLKVSSIAFRTYFKIDIF